MVSRRSGSAIAVAEYERMLATTREAGPMRDADELLLHIICPVMVGTLRHRAYKRRSGRGR
jgi:hypothetical protein